MLQVSVKQAWGVDATNAYRVHVNRYGVIWDHIVHTDSNGKGLWIDGRQVKGTGEFDAGSDPASAIRNYIGR